MDKIESKLTSESHNKDCTNIDQDSFKMGVIFAQKWINVRNKKPEKRGDYLCKYVNCVGDTFFVVLFFDGCIFLKDDRIGKITHWRPIEIEL